MFFGIGTLELVALVILGVIVFGPEKLPKVIQDVARTIRKIREFSDSAKEDIRKELGPEFKDFEFEDLNPKNFARKHLLENEDIKELTNGFDLKKEVAEVKDAVSTVADVNADVETETPAGSTKTEEKAPVRHSLSKSEPANLSKEPAEVPEQSPKKDVASDVTPATPFDADAT